MCGTRKPTALMVAAAAIVAAGSGVAGAQTSTPCGNAPPGMNVIVSDGPVIDGTVGDDFICAGDSANDIDGKAGNDIIFGRGGDDLIRGRAGDDVIHGGAGDDNIRGSAGNDVIDGDGGNDRVHGGDDADRISGSEGVDRLTGDDGRDVIFGGDDRDIIRGVRGADVLYGNGGDDVVFGGTGNDRVFGGTGSDELIGGAGNDDLRGGTGDDLLDGRDGDDELQGEDGVDASLGGTGIDICSSSETLIGCEDANGDPVNSTPVVDSVELSVAENVAAGLTVGTVTAADADGDVLTFSITGGNTAGAFLIDGITGEITTTTSLDFEDTASYSLTVDVHDGDTSGFGTVTISVDDRNEAPSIVWSLYDIDENAAPGTEVGTLIVDDEDEGDVLSFFVMPGLSVPFSIDDNGVITADVTLDFEVDPAYYLFTVLVVDLEGLSDTARIEVIVNDIDEGQ